MSDFSKSEWSDASSAQAFIDEAQRYIPERARMYRLLASFLKQAVAPRFPSKRLSVVEFGSGDGALSQTILRENPGIRLVLLDGSQEMLEGARRRFSGAADVDCLHATFQELLAGKPMPGPNHFVVSSLAIHHLVLEEKRRLFRLAGDSLETHGAFVNIDVVLPPPGSLDAWYHELWREWIEANDGIVADGKTFTHVPMKAKCNPDNMPDTLEAQLEALRDAGFAPVDTFFKCGVFAVFGGFKPAA